VKGIIAILIGSIFVLNSALALDYKVSLYHSPNKDEVTKLNGYPGKIQLAICCEYPTQEDLANIKAVKLSKLVIQSGHFPTISQIKVMAALIQDKGIPVEIMLDEVFPSDIEIANINKLAISKLMITSRDWPMPGEVEFLNKLTIPVRFQITKKEWPRKEHMIIMQKIKPEITVGFTHRMVPGIGYADFFNGLKTKKVFVVEEQFPYGEDPIGMNALKDSDVEIAPIEKLMPQDIVTLNKFTVPMKINLVNSWPLDQDFFNLVGQIKAVQIKEIEIKDPGYGDLLKDSYVRAATNIESINSNLLIVYSLDQVY